jgi:hypothetical protein
MNVSRCKFFVNQDLKQVLTLPLTMRQKLLFIFPATALIIFLSVSGSIENDYTKAQESKYEPAIRLIGHRLLLSGGDTR